MKKSKGEWCRQCQGQGIAIHHIRGELSPDEKSIVASNVGYTLCPRCQGIGVVGIPELEHLSPQQTANLVRGKSPQQLFDLLVNKSHEELADIIRNIPSQTD